MGLLEIMRGHYWGPWNIIEEGTRASHVFSDSAYDPPTPPALSWLWTHIYSTLATLCAPQNGWFGCSKSKRTWMVFCLVSALPLFGWDTDSKSIMLRGLGSHFLSRLFVCFPSLTSPSHRNVLNRVIRKSGCVSRCIAGVSVQPINR